MKLSSLAYLLDQSLVFCWCTKCCFEYDDDHHPFGVCELTSIVVIGTTVVREIRNIRGLHELHCKERTIK